MDDAAFFRWAAKTGCLEGYLYTRPRIDVATMEDWLGNIAAGYAALDAPGQAAVRDAYREVLLQIADHYAHLPDGDAAIAARIAAMIAGLSIGPAS